jgi:hypothetical protein
MSHHGRAGLLRATTSDVLKSGELFTQSAKGRHASAISWSSRPWETIASLSVSSGVIVTISPQ